MGNRISTFTDIPKEEIGFLGDGRKEIGKAASVSIINSLYQIADEVREHIGHLIIDECHRTPARTFTEAVKAFDCKYMLGLSATPYRRDKLSQLIYYCVGDIHHKIDQAELEETGAILKAKIIPRYTDFYYPYIDDYQAMLEELTHDLDRNKLIANDITKVAKNGNGDSCLILSDRTEHCKTLQTLLSKRGMEAEVLTGKVANGQRKEIVAEVNKGNCKVLIATGQLIGEGFDCKPLSTLFITTPLKWTGRVIQYVGRILRPAPGKDKAVVYDYVDSNIGVLKAAFKSRCKVWGKISQRE